MASTKQLPIGIDNFKILIDNNYYFVDKTLMIRDVIHNIGMVNLYPRPRRFGKTLNMSMMQYYFEKSAEDNSYLFDSLHISTAGEQYRTYMGKYPVISLSLKSMKQDTFEQAFFEFKTLMMQEFIRHENAVKSANIAKGLMDRYRAIADGTAEDALYPTSIRLLCDCLRTAYDQKVIILIDEYDVPLENAHFNGFYDRMTGLIRSVFESALKTNPSMEFAALTGCLRVSKESIFTGLNNLKVNSIRTDEYSEYFGFTEAEVRKLTEDYDISETFPQIKEWYDGYRFGRTEIYNPWSVLNFIQAAKTNPQTLPEPYWINTSSNEIIHQLVAESDETTRRTIEELLAGGSITVPVYEDIVYANVKVNRAHIWSFLLFTGYLKQVHAELREGTIYLTMVIPNQEVKSIYRRSIMQWFEESVHQSEVQVFDAAIAGDAARLEDEINNWLLDYISYFDGQENYYHGFLAGLLLGKRGYSVKSNRETGNGRSDILIQEYQKRKLAVIIEVKAAAEFSQLDQKCDEALQQIEDRQYAAEQLKDGYQKVIKYGIAFHDKCCRVKMGE